VPSTPRICGTREGGVRTRRSWRIEVIRPGEIAVAVTVGVLASRQLVGVSTAQRFPQTARKVQPFLNRTTSRRFIRFAIINRLHWLFSLAKSSGRTIRDSAPAQQINRPEQHLQRTFPMGFKTDAIQKGVYADETYNSVTTPIYPSSTFAFRELGTLPQFDYTRSGNPTRHALEVNLAALEGGVGASIQCTGMAAITTAMFLFKPGDHVITGKHIYGGTYRLFTTILQRHGIEFSFVDMNNHEEIRAAAKPNTKLIWIETPSNPLMILTDIEAVVKIAREIGAITIADNTFMSPYFQRPLDLGVD